MRVGIVGLCVMYYPIALGDGLKASEHVEFVGAATLGVSETAIRETLGIGPAEYADRYGLKLYDQAERMIAEEHLDAVALMTRHTDHAAWVERMAQCGVNMYIPKTFATTIEDAERIVRAQRRYGIKIAVGPSARYFPSMLAVKDALDQGLIGKPFTARICHHHGTIDSFSSSDWYREPLQGGPEFSLAWYGIDLVLHLMGGEVNGVYAEYGNFTSPDSPFMDCGRIMLRMDGDRFASFDMYFCNRFSYPSWQLEIAGPGGVVSIHRSGTDAGNTSVGLTNSEGYRTLPVPADELGWERAWIDDINEDREPVISAEFARQITEISLAARDSAGTGRFIPL